MTNKKSREKYSLKTDAAGILHIDEQAQPTEESTAAMRDQVIELAGTLPEPRLAVIDLTGASIPSAEARHNLVEMIQQSKFEKIAIFGSTTPLRVLAGFIIKAARAKNMQIFSSEQEALDWLGKK
jgi:hypothetical protein